MYHILDFLRASRSGELRNSIFFINTLFLVKENLEFSKFLTIS
jgi:hypothetical protein